MALSAKQLSVKKSGIPGAGRGLFTRVPIRKGSQIIEYKGTLTTWGKVNHDGGKNRYIFYVNRKHVIDASTHKKALARYANDARGLERIKGLANNAAYEVDGGKVFIVATRNIPAGHEILVDYGREYWQVIRHNRKLEQNSKTKV